MTPNFEVEKIQHIIVDEAQNFRTENGDWYMKAKRITQRMKTCPQIFWIFLDYFQTSHQKESGLPDFLHQYPKEELTKVVRNADKIAEFLQKISEKIRSNPPPIIPRESLNMVCEFNWSQGVSGTCKLLTSLGLEQMARYVAERCYFS